MARRKRNFHDSEAAFGERDTHDAYRYLHWGDDPTGIEDVRVVNSPFGVPVGRVKACSYTTIKGGEPATFRHVFAKVRGKYPALLEGLEKGSTPDFRRHKKISTLFDGQDVIAIGRLIDLELEDGRVVLTPFMWVCTTLECFKRDLKRTPNRSGGPVLFASRFDVPYAIEHRAGCPYVTEHGIIS